MIKVLKLALFGFIVSVILVLAFLTLVAFSFTIFIAKHLLYAKVKS
jgi:hypothetical protein